MAKYKPVLAEHNDNVSHESPLKEFFTLLLGLVLAMAIVTYLLGFVVEKAVDYLPYEHEAALFEKVPFDWTNMLGGESAPKPNARLQSLLDALRKCSVLPVDITVLTVANQSANAVALPGGTMLVFDGLFEAVKSENGLAFVLAHELGHFINRDHLKGLGRGMVLVTLSSLLTGPRSSLSRLLTPGLALDTAHFSQKRESLADQTALEIVNCHYGHVKGATEFFESIKTEAGFNSPLSHYFSSHPEIESRIADIKVWQALNQAKNGETVAW